ncbi:MAG: hypothetical protein NVSMB39_2520 [Candidatus Saccharimonadales bacterium]
MVSAYKYNQLGIDYRKSDINLFQKEIVKLGPEIAKLEDRINRGHDLTGGVQFELDAKQGRLTRLRSEIQRLEGEIKNLEANKG